MKFDVNCQFLDAKAKPYDFEGREGIAYSCRVSVEGEDFRIKLSKALYDELLGRDFKKLDDFSCILMYSAGDRGGYLSMVELK